MIGREYVRIWGVLSLVFGLAESDLSSRGDQVRPPKGVLAAEPAWEAVFRLPNVPPKVEFHFCPGVSTAESAPESAWLSGAREPSAAEPAAEPGGE